MDTDHEDAIRTRLEAALHDCQGDAGYHVRAALQYLAVGAARTDGAPLGRPGRPQECPCGPPS